jgi:hypothetical protein
MDVKVFDKDGKLICGVMKGDYAYYYAIYAVMFLALLMLVALIAELISLDKISTLILFLKVFAAIVLEYFAIKLVNRWILKPQEVIIRPCDVEGKLVRFVTAPWWYFGNARKFKVFIPGFPIQSFMVHNFQGAGFHSALTDLDAEIEMVPYSKEAWSK